MSEFIEQSMRTLKPGGMAREWRSVQYENTEQCITDLLQLELREREVNLEFSWWNTVFGDNRLTAAPVDRLIHHSHIVIFSSESYRLIQSIRRQCTSP